MSHQTYEVAFTFFILGWFSALGVMALLHSLDGKK